jgi:hypothetical protein
MSTLFSGFKEETSLKQVANRLIDSLFIYLITTIKCICYIASDLSVVNDELKFWKEARMALNYP